MQIDGDVLSLEEITKNGNLVAGLVISRLHIDGLISEEEAKEYLDKWQVIAVKTAWHSRWKSVFFKNKTTTMVYKFVKFED